MDQGDGRHIIHFDAAVYSLKAIKNASYDFTDKANVVIETLSSGKVRVCLEPIGDTGINVESVIPAFSRLALDHQVRLDVAEDYKLIREMIVAQAFEPVDNLEQVMGSLKP